MLIDPYNTIYAVLRTARLGALVLGPLVLTVVLSSFFLLDPTSAFSGASGRGHKKTPTYGSRSGFLSYSGSSIGMICQVLLGSSLN
jgi:hypothetical protein